MPANQRALRVTDAYRSRVIALHSRAQAVTRANWRASIDAADLDASSRAFIGRTAPALTVLQTAGARLSAGYLAGYVAASTGRAAATTGASTAAPAGVSRTGAPLADALAQPIIAVKSAIKDGHGLQEALAIGSGRAIRNAGEDLMFTARTALFSGIASHEELVGWRRVTSGGCGACMALADGAILPDDSDIEVHDNCQCSAEPVVRDVPDEIQRPTGVEMFDALAPDAQDQLLGPDKARLVRDGQVPFHALVARSPMSAIADQITEAPLEALHH